MTETHTPLHVEACQSPTERWVNFPLADLSVAFSMRDPEAAKREIQAHRNRIEQHSYGSHGAIEEAERKVGMWGSIFTAISADPATLLRMPFFPGSREGLQQLSPQGLKVLRDFSGSLGVSIDDMYEENRGHEFIAAYTPNIYHHRTCLQYRRQSLDSPIAVLTVLRYEWITQSYGSYLFGQAQHALASSGFLYPQEPANISFNFIEGALGSYRMAPGKTHAVNIVIGRQHELLDYYSQPDILCDPRNWGGFYQAMCHEATHQAHCERVLGRFAGTKDPRAQEGLMVRGGAPHTLRDWLVEGIAVYGELLGNKYARDRPEAFHLTEQQLDSLREAHNQAVYRLISAQRVERGLRRRYVLQQAGCLALHERPANGARLAQAVREEERRSVHAVHTIDLRRFRARLPYGAPGEPAVVPSENELTDRMHALCRQGRYGTRYSSGAIDVVRKLVAKWGWAVTFGGDRPKIIDVDLVECCKVEAGTGEYYRLLDSLELPMLKRM